MDLEAAENNKKLNALHLATISGMENSVIFLLSLGINPDIQEKKDIHLYIMLLNLIK